jgi:hypothetical protein
MTARLSSLGLCTTTCTCPFPSVWGREKGIGSLSGCFQMFMNVVIENPYTERFCFSTWGGVVGFRGVSFHLLRPEMGYLVGHTQGVLCFSKVMGWLVGAGRLALGHAVEQRARWDGRRRISIKYYRVYVCAFLMRIIRILDAERAMVDAHETTV